MPFPNFHACRLRDPDDFQDGSFRIEERESDGKTYLVVMGRLKGEDTLTEQAYRYPKETWSEAEARAHCREHDGILFEPAAEDENANRFGGPSSMWGADASGAEPCCGAIDEADLSDTSRANAIPDPQRIIYPRESRIRHSHILDAFSRSPWAILPEKLTVLQEIIARHVYGERLDPDEVQMAIHGAKRPEDRKINGANGANVAVLPLFGTIFPRANLMTDVSGATSAEVFGAKFDELVNDPEVGAIVLDVDSPGGHAKGIEEPSQKIYAARGKKPIVAVANHTMDSAAYWIGTSADEVVVTPSGEVGSIGVFAAHWDESKALEMEGLKLTLISEGKFKTEANPFEPLTEEARSAIHVLVKETYDGFVRGVARNRGKTVDEVRNGFGEGRVVGARQAVALGMADRIGTLEDTIRQLQRRIYRLTKEQNQQADALRARVKTILVKGKQNDD